MLKNIFKNTFKCPYCFGEHKISDCTLVCLKGESCKKKFCNEHGEVHKDNYSYCMKRCKSSAVRLYCPEKGQLDKFENFVKKKQIDKDVSLSLDIPSEFIDGTETITVAILGGVSSGKSSFITVLVNEMNKKLRRAFGCNVRTLNTTTQEIYEKIYYSWVYRKNHINEKTLENDNVPPLLYNLEFPDNLMKKRVNLAIYDVAGEDIRGSGKMIEDRGFIANADMIVVLLDPTQMKKVRRGVKDPSTLPAENESENTVFDRLVETYRSVKKVRGRIPVPVAVCVSKLDVLKENFYENTDSELFGESRHILNKAYTHSDFVNTQNGIKTILGKHADVDPVSSLRTSFKKYALFGFSALGTTPERADKISEADINSYRVLDPIVWSLYKKGYIKKMDERDKK